MSKFQEAGIFLRLGFALSKWPHFDSVCLLRGRFVLLSIVFSTNRYIVIWLSWSHISICLIKTPLYLHTFYLLSNHYWSMEKGHVFNAAKWGISRVQVLGSQKLKKMQGIFKVWLSIANQVEPSDPKPRDSQAWGLPTRKHCPQRMVSLIFKPSTGP